MFCENGAKALAWEATERRVTPEFFASHTVSGLAAQSDYWLELQGRLIHPGLLVFATGVLGLLIRFRILGAKIVLSPAPSEVHVNIARRRTSRAHASLHLS